MHGVGHADYYIKLAQQDYYTAEGHEPGRWSGPGADRLGLSDTVQSQAYANLLWGRSPDGRRPLVQNANDEHRQTGWDLTFSAPKSVSVPWAVGPEAIGKQIVAAHRDAVETALKFLQETAGLTRRGKGGQRLERTDLLFATFLHKTSRAHDPQLHTHCLLINLGVRADGTTGALWSKEFFRAKILAGAIYQVQLAANLSQEPGLPIRPDRIGFQVDGVPKNLCGALSKRRQAIEAVLDKRGTRDAVTAKRVAEETRPRKVVMSEQALRSVWQQTAETFGWNQASVMNLVHQTQVQRCSQRELEQRFRAEAAKLPAEKQTPRRLLGLAAAVAVELGADARMFRPLLRLVSGDQKTMSHAQPTQKTAEARLQDRMDNTAPLPKSRVQATEDRVTEAAPRGQSGESFQEARAAQGQAPSQEPPLGEVQAVPIHAPTAETSKQEPQVARPPAPSAHLQDEKTAGGREENTHAREDRSRTEGRSSTKAGPQAARPGPAGPEQDSEKGQRAQAHSSENVHADEGAAQRSKSEGKQNRSQAQHGEQEGAAHERGHSTQGRSSRHQRTRQSREGTGPRSAKSRMEENARLLESLDPRLVHSKNQQEQLFFRWKDFMARGRGQELFSPHPFPVGDKQARSNERFVRAVENTQQQIPTSEQTRQRLTWDAVKLACAHRADVRTLYETLRDLRPVAEFGRLYMGWQRLFPKAPSWSPVRNWKAPVVGLRLGIGRSTYRKWGRVLWRKNLVLGELRRQKRRLFPKAPKWSPVHGWEVSALRLMPNSAKSGWLKRLAQTTKTKMKAKMKAKKKDKMKTKKKDKSQSQSH